MLIPKKKVTTIILNPFRPKIGIPRTHSICRIGWGEFHVEEHEVVERLAVDADPHEEFESLIESTVPKEDRYRHSDHEVWLIDAKWKKFLVDTAKGLYDEVKIELRKW